jgi:hypothetical protein
LGWKLDSLELSDPPFGEFHTVVNGLYKQQHELYKRHSESSPVQENEYTSPFKRNNYTALIKLFTICILKKHATYLKNILSVSTITFI